MSRQNQPDPDDMFADTRMSFPDHIEDLRTHLLRAVYGFVFFFIFAFVIAKPVLKFIAAPVENVLGKYYQEMFEEKAQEIMAGHQGSKILLKTEMRFDPKRLKEILGGHEPILEKMIPSIEKGLIQIGLEDWFDPEIDDKDMVSLPVYITNPLEWMLKLEKLRTIIRPPTLSTLSVQEAFVVWVKVALLTGLVLSSPWVFFQIWAFVAAGLFPHEKRLVHVYLPVSLFLFLGGVFMCEFFVIPKAVEALLWFNKYLGLQPDLRLSEWLGFAIFMPLVFGISFQTPMVMFFLNRIGVMDVAFFREKRKVAIILLAVFAAVITPSTDALSMLFLLVPMCLLYELGIIMCVMSPGSKFLDSEFEESEDLIEV